MFTDLIVVIVVVYCKVGSRVSSKFSVVKGVSHGNSSIRLLSSLVGVNHSKHLQRKSFSDHRSSTSGSSTCSGSVKLEKCNEPRMMELSAEGIRSIGVSNT